MVKLLPDQLAALDRYITDQGGALSRPEAIRRLIDRGLAPVTDPYEHAR